MNRRTNPEKPGETDFAARAADKKGQRRDTGAIIRRLWTYLRHEKWLVLLAVTLSLASNLLALIGPMLCGYAIDAIGQTKGQVNFGKVIYYCLWMLVFYAASSLLSYVLSVLMIRLSQRVVFAMRNDLFQKLADLPVRYFDNHQTGDILSKISYDVDTVNASLSTDLLQIATSVITVIGSLVMMLILSPWLVLVFAVTIPISILMTQYMTSRVRPLFRRRSAKLGELNGFVEETISGQKTIKTYHQEKPFIARFDHKNKEAVDSYYDGDYYGTIPGPSVNFINNLSLALVSILGAILFLFGHLTLGNFSSFVLYSRKFSGPINEAANILSDLQSTFAAADRVFRLIDEPAEPADAANAIRLNDVAGQVDLTHIDFGYTPEKTIIKDLNLHVEPGRLVAIVGHTGAGKTTIINLLMRFYDPDSGTIAIDGRPIQGVTRESLRLSYAMVLQDTWLFYGSVYENLAYGKKDATRSEVEAVAKAARIDHYIRNLPEGYDTLLNDEGMNISQGQKQLLTIARAMLLDARILILDEATSNVDTRTEQLIQGAMRQLMRGKTCFVIAHRLSTIQNADEILVVRDGQVVEQGDHGALMAKGGVYAELYQSQFQ